MGTKWQSRLVNLANLTDFLRILREITPLEIIGKKSMSVVDISYDCGYNHSALRQGADTEEFGTPASRAETHRMRHDTDQPFAPRQPSGRRLRDDCRALFFFACATTAAAPPLRIAAFPI